MKRALLAVLLALAVVGRLEAQTYSLAPPPYQTVLNNNGDKVSNACVWTYAAGTTTPIATYSDNLGTTNTNPIRTDSAGRFTAYLVPGTAYKFTYEQPCTPPAHGVILRTADNIAGTPSATGAVDTSGLAGEALAGGDVVYLSDGSGGKSAGQWYKADASQAYSSTTPPIGVATGPIPIGTSGTIRLEGAVTYVALVAGSTYYVGTAGALTVTAPTNRRVVGVAQSPTTLLLSANPSAAATPWVNVAYNAANFTTGGSGMTWTVDAGDQLSFAYQLSGTTMSLNFWLSATTLGGTAGTELWVAIPAGKTSAAYTTASCFLGATLGLALLTPGATALHVLKPDQSAFVVPTTNAQTASCSLTFQVQ